MATQQIKLIVGAVIFWTFFFIVLFGGMIPSTSLLRDYKCTIEDFMVDPRFECHHKCPKLSDSKDPPSHLPHCDALERETLEDYNPGLCLAAPFDYEDEDCPPEAAACLAGRNYKRKCLLECPLAYKINVSFNVEHIGHIEKERDLGLDREKYLDYKDQYVPGKTLTCQVLSTGRDNPKDVRWIDERINRKTLNWWKWSLLILSIIGALCMTAGALALYLESENAARYASVPSGTGFGTQPTQP